MIKYLGNASLTALLGLIKSKFATKTEVASKQDKLTFDTTPTAGSNNPVTSGGVKSALDNKLSLTGGTLTGNLDVPSVQTGSAEANYFQCRKFRGEGNANTYYHAIDFGYAGHDVVDFYEYGGIWNFWKNTSSNKGGTLVGSIQSTGWNGNVVGNVTGNLTGLASKATADSSGNNIKNTYATKTSLNNYLTTSDASSTYATKTILGNYLKTSDASTTYATKDELTPLQSKMDGFKFINIELLPNTITKIGSTSMDKSCRINLIVDVLIDTDGSGFRSIGHSYMTLDIAGGFPVLVYNDMTGEVDLIPYAILDMSSMAVDIALCVTNETTKLIIQDYQIISVYDSSFEFSKDGTTFTLDTANIKEGDVYHMLDKIDFQRLHNLFLLAPEECGRTAASGNLFLIGTLDASTISSGVATITLVGLTDSRVEIIIDFSFKSTGGASFYKTVRSGGDVSGLSLFYKETTTHGKYLLYMKNTNSDITILSYNAEATAVEVSWGFYKQDTTDLVEIQDSASYLQTEYAFDITDR